MDQNALTLLFKAVADALAPHIVENVIDRLNTSGMLTTEIDTRIQAKIDGLVSLDKAFITDIVRGEIEDSNLDNKISDWMNNNFDINDLDDKISDWMDNNFDITDHESNLDINDKIDDYLSDRLTAMVRDEVRDLSFSVTVD